MLQLSAEYPNYDWANNKGYPTLKHRNAVLAFGLTPYHRKTFRITDPQLSLPI
jgi:ribonuclease HII